MDLLPPWAISLGIDLKQIKAWIAEGAPSDDLLGWCLDKGHVSETNYLAWAKEFYQLPVVKPDFFEQPIPKELFSSNAAVWSQGLIPLQEWDGIIFAGCQEPPVNAIPNIQPVLTPRSLQKIWWQGFNEVTAPQTEMPDAPLGLSLDIPSPPSTVAPSDAPVFTLSLALAENHGNAEAPAFPLPKVPTPPPPPSPTLKLEIAPAFAPPPPVAPAILTPVIATPSLTTPPFVAPVLITPAPIATSIVPEANVSQQNNSIFSKFAADEIFEKMNSDFNLCMIIEAHYEQLQPVYWNESWTSIPSQIAPVETQGPCVFRIVLDSKGPYHGYIASSPLNTAFFNIWNKGAYPEHLTIVPIMKDGVIVGMLLGGTTKSQASSVVLQIIESYAKTLAEKIQISTAA